MVLDPLAALEAVAAYSLQSIIKYIQSNPVSDFLDFLFIRDIKAMESKVTLNSWHIQSTHFSSALFQRPCDFIHDGVECLAFFVAVSYLAICEGID